MIQWTCGLVAGLLRMAAVFAAMGFVSHPDMADRRRDYFIALRVDVCQIADVVSVVKQIAMVFAKIC
jgi:hypothetical protein